MSGPEVIVGNEERALTCADRTKSVDAISDRDRSSISINGESFRASSENLAFRVGELVYTWSDGGCYVGTWTRGLKDGKGSFYPKGSRFQAVEEWYLNALRKRGVLPDLRKQNHALIHHASSVNMGNVKVGENQGSRHNSSDKLSKGNLLTLEQSRNKNVSLERRWSLEVYIEKVIGHDSSLDLSEGLGKEFETNTPPILEREYMQGVLISELVLNSSFSSSSRRTKRRQKKLAKEVKRPGEAIIKGHRSYDLMLSLQLGIRYTQSCDHYYVPSSRVKNVVRYTVGKITPVQRREVRASDFGPRASFWMNFPKDGSQLTPPHQSEDFKWKDYCPMVFRQIEIDSKFLEVQHIMDYSLLLGVHYRAPQHLRSLMSYNRSISAEGLGVLAEEDTIEDENYPQGLVLVPRGTDDDSVVVGPHIRGSRLRASSAGDEEVDLLLPGTARLQIQLGVNMPARAEQTPGEEEKQTFHEAYDVVLYLGIIDILQEYNMSKKIEHAYKSLQFDSLSISAVDPTFYSRRFLEFIQKVFPPNVITS
ncbi:hypothetical protein H0E87_012799 [Populus deltoides]|uniref:1-phosphatidylinositol-4-phosphate 5-kinase n=1 Tax=Populus deltoides TaxID=3696 RepID=A0A8T2YKT9_POPDE|nr:hypothetical protein H0E87_012799 [Populus deltoides]